jgi:uncharacterized membrane protein
MKNATFIFAAVFAALAAFPAFAQSPLNTVKPAVKDRDVVIPVAEVGENAVFYPVDVDGSRLEVIAVRAPDGSIRTVFNTCQSCYRSGRGFYKQEGTVLVCQNCGKRFRMSRLETSSGGCNPVPIFPPMKKVTSETITVPLAVLKEAKVIFANWRRD